MGDGGVRGSKSIRDCKGVAAFGLRRRKGGREGEVKAFDRDKLVVRRRPRKTQKKISLFGLLQASHPIVLIVRIP